MSEAYDVIVVGGGPAGTACAKVLVGEGLKTLVLERKRLPRNKCCSGILFSNGKELVEEIFGEIPERCLAGTVTDTLAFIDENRQAVPYPFGLDKPVPKRPMQQVWRKEFDYWLIEKSGAEVMDGLACNSITEERGKVKIGTTNGSVLKCDYVVGADGGDSRVRRILFPELEERIKCQWAYQVYYTIWDIELDMAYYYAFMLPSLQGFHGGLGMKENVLCLCVHGGKGKKPMKAMEEFRVYLQEHAGLSVGVPIRKEATRFNPMAAKGITVLGSGNILLAGEAGGLTNLNVEGITPAIRSGAIAGKAIMMANASCVDAEEIYVGEVRNVVNDCLMSWNVEGKEV